MAFAAAVGALVVAAAGGAAAQSAGGTEPATIEQRLERRDEAPRKAPAVTAPAPAAEQPHAEPPTPEEPPRTVLGAVVVEGATVFAPERLAAAYKPYITREIGFKELREIAEAITAMYHDAGYFLSRARVPPQLPELGILRLEVVEGWIDEVAFAGNLERRESLYRAYGDKLAAGRPTRLATVERYVLLLGDLPGITASGAVEEIDGDGRYRLVVEVERDAVAAYANVDNRGTRAVGRYEALLDVAVNGLLDGRDRTAATLFTVPNQPKELIYGEVRHSRTFGSEGFTVTVRASHSESDAGGNFQASDLGSQSSRAAVEAAYPLLRTRDANLWLNGSFEANAQRQEEFGQETYDDQLRVARGWLFADLTDGIDGYNSLQLTYSRGLDVLGATPEDAADVSRSRGQAAFDKLYGELRRYQPFGDNWAIDAKVAGQWSGERLLAAEEFYLGGNRYGRAYDPGELGGSHGVAGSVELQWAEYAEVPWLEVYQLYGFYDAGAVWETSENGYAGRETLASAGTGVRLTFPGELYAGLELAKPLTRPVEAIGPDATGFRLFFYASGNF